MRHLATVVISVEGGVCITAEWSRASATADRSTAAVCCMLRCCLSHCSAAFRIYKGRAEVARRVGQLNWLAGPERAPRRREAVHLPRGCRRGREISACGGVLLRQWRPPLCHLVESSALEVAGEEDGEDQEGRRLGQVPVEERRRATLRRV